MGSDGYISASGASAQLRDLDVVANNLANVGTPGFKRSHSVFRTALEASLQDAKGQAQPGAKASAFVSTDSVSSDFTRGSAEHTGSPLHAAIDGSGFFEVETANGLRYTRAGNFMVNREGFLATPSGDAVMGQNGPIALLSSDSMIEPNGAIIDSVGNVAGRLKVVDFENPHALVREGESVFRGTPEAAQVDAVDPGFIPRSVETSNVQSSKELAAMVMLQRAFETNLRAMQMNDETTQQLIEGIR
ncbi:MAG: flagellar hook-basal body protein [Myxococcota bacterium]